MWFLKLVAYFVLVSWSFSITASEALAQKCAEHEELIELAVEAPNVIPCDGIGQAYVLGRFGFGAIRRPFNDSYDSKYDYYINTRGYLALKRNWPEGEVDAEQFLGDFHNLFLVLHFVEWEEDEFRRTAYKAFVNFEYLLRGAKTRGQQEDHMEVMADLIGPTEISHAASMLCFIEFDIPTLPVSTILDSAQFRECDSKKD